jgi:hypothetical protein
LLALAELARVCSGAPNGLDRLPPPSRQSFRKPPRACLIGIPLTWSHARTEVTPCCSSH